jgi:hypothetical protein
MEQLVARQPHQQVTGAPTPSDPLDLLGTKVLGKQQPRWKKFGKLVSALVMEGASTKDVRVHQPPFTSRTNDQVHHRDRFQRAFRTLTKSVLLL